MVWTSRKNREYSARGGRSRPSDDLSGDGHPQRGTHRQGNIYLLRVRSALLALVHWSMRAATSFCDDFLRNMRLKKDTFRLKIAVCCDGWRDRSAGGAAAVGNSGVQRGVPEPLLADKPFGL